MRAIQTKTRVFFSAFEATFSAFQHGFDPILATLPGRMDRQSGDIASHSPQNSSPRRPDSSVQATGLHLLYRRYIPGWGLARSVGGVKNTNGLRRVNHPPRPV